MLKGQFLSALLHTPQTVLTTAEISLVWSELAGTASRKRLNYYVHKGDLIRLRRGIFAKDKNYNKYELATKIVTPSYISFETILVKTGLIFQFYEPIFLASYLTRNLIVDHQEYNFRKIKLSILLNSKGINQDGIAWVATTERAFLDTLYLYPGYHFDNLRSLEWEKVAWILPIYDNLRLTRYVNSLKKAAAQ